MLRTEIVYANLAAIRTYLPQLDAALVPSNTRRRWHQRDMSAEHQARMNALAVSEREAKEINLRNGLKALGDGRAPLNLTVLDARDVVQVGIVEMEEAVCEALAMTPSAHTPTRERITRIIGLLDRLVWHEDLAEHVHDEARRLRQTARIALGETEPIVRLSLRCVVCESLSLRALLERGDVVCVSQDCRCDDQDCPCWREEPRRHSWPFEHWPWLLPLLTEGVGVEAPSSEVGNL
ncbi:hypothetical protein ACIBH1_05560 [Nonomuraea sp. NPDC050663]|uniref:hypothetical protein n=1 Tax=Nonomuraea sp. NPDC050663 TaxID=3364370 RepID=UPI0037A368D1